MSKFATLLAAALLSTTFVTGAMAATDAGNTAKPAAMAKVTKAAKPAKATKAVKPVKAEKKVAKPAAKAAVKPAK